MLPPAGATPKTTPDGRGAAARRGWFGIKLQLLMAFAAVAAMTVLAAEVDIVSFSATERGMERVATQEVPVMTDALRLSPTSGEVSAAAARLVNAATADEQRSIGRAIAQSADQMAEIMNRLRASQKDNAGFATVEEISQRLDPNLQALETAVSERRRHALRSTRASMPSTSSTPASANASPPSWTTW